MNNNLQGNGHTLVLDQRGEGQELLTREVLATQIAFGGAVIVVGNSINGRLLASIVMQAEQVGRLGDVLVVNPAKPGHSHTYNPVLQTAPAKVANHVLNFVADLEANAQVDSPAAAALLEAIVSCLQLASVPYSFLDLGMFVMKPGAIGALFEHMLSAYPASPQLKALEGSIAPFCGTDGAVSSDLLKAQFAGLAGSMCMAGSGRAGEVFNSYDPDVSLDDVIANGKILYLAIPYIGRGAGAGNLRRIVTSNLADAVDRVRQDHSSVPALVVFTDAGACNSPCIERLLSCDNEPVANIWVSAGSLDDLGRESADLREVCLSKARNIVFFKPTSSATADLYMKLLTDADGADETRQKLMAFTSTQFVTASAGSDLQWHDARPSSTFCLSPDELARPVRRFHDPMTGADQFTQTVPV